MQQRQNNAPKELVVLPALLTLCRTPAFLASTASSDEL
jgi:hypothetical protein